jgi:plasmid stabilization system protein ParE
VKVAILPPAQRDLLDGFWFYEDQKPGLGGRFHRTLFAAIDSLRHTGGIPRRFGHYHRLLIRLFPYAVYYRVQDDTCLIDAVIDCRRGPEWIRARLGRR